MTRRLTVLLAALESVFVVAFGVAIPLVPLTIVWAAHFGFGPDWLIFWRGAVDVWLIGHGVDVTFTLDADTAALLGVAGAADPVRVTLALLGFALLTVLLALRVGARVVESGHRRLGQLSALGAFALLSLGVTLTAVHPAARPSIWQGVLLPTLVFALGLWLGGRRADRDAGVGAVAGTGAAWLATRTRNWPIEVRASVAAALRGGAAAVALVFLASGIAVAVLLLVHYGDIIRLYESLHTEVVGGIAITAGQLALLPDLIVWAASWFVGPGFAIGTGSHVSPLGTALGPLPAIPVLGAIPTGDLPLAFAGLLVPIVAGFFAGVAIRPALVRALDGMPAIALLGTALGGGLFGGLLLGLLSWAAAGSAGPGRLVDVGPDPIAVGLAAALEIAVALALGLASGAVLRRREAREPAR